MIFGKTPYLWEKMRIECGVKRYSILSSPVFAKNKLSDKVVCDLLFYLKAYFLYLMGLGYFSHRVAISRMYCYNKTK